MSNPLIANISLLFADSPMQERFQRAADLGFRLVEIQFPYEWPAADLKAWADAAGVSVYLINVPAGDLLTGGHSYSCHSQYHNEFLAACKQALEYGRELGVSYINVLASNIDETDDREACLSVYVESIRYAAELMVHEGIQVTFEAINNIDMPRYLVNSFDEMKAVYDAVAHPNAFMQYDIYHMAMMDEPVQAQLETHAPAIGHIQFADAPGRGAPNTGRLPLADIFQQLEAGEYSGGVAAEYRISGDDEKDYGWLRG